MNDSCTECDRKQFDSYWTVGSLSADLCAEKGQRTVEMTMGVLAAQTGGLAKTVSSVAVVTDGATEVTHLYEMVVGAPTDKDTLSSRFDKGELCLGRKYLDKGVSPWRGFGLGKSQNVELSYDGLQPWVNSS